MSQGIDTTVLVHELQVGSSVARDGQRSFVLDECAQRSQQVMCRDDHDPENSRTACNSWRTGRVPIIYDGEALPIGCSRWPAIE